MSLSHTLILNKHTYTDNLLKIIFLSWFHPFSKLVFSRQIQVFDWLLLVEKWKSKNVFKTFFWKLNNILLKGCLKNNWMVHYSSFYVKLASNLAITKVSTLSLQVMSWKIVRWESLQFGAFLSICRGVFDFCERWKFTNDPEYYPLCTHYSGVSF